MKSFILIMLATSYLLQGKHINTSTVPQSADPAVMGVFEGKSPCQEIMKELNIKVARDCFKLKWLITFLQDPGTRKPTTYQLRGTSTGHKIVTGKWSVIYGAEIDPQAIVYQLIPDEPGEPIYLLKGDDNVLFFLDRQKKLLVGNDEFSYTLNRRTK